MRYRSAGLLLLLCLGCSARNTILSQAEVNRLPDGQRRTMETIRALAIAVESYSIDKNMYPGPSVGFVNVEHLASFLVPTYLDPLPTTDGWGRRLLFWSNNSGYAVVSQGSDGMSDQDYVDLGMTTADLIERSICGGATSNQAHDIVLMDGAFCQWPVIP